MAFIDASPFEALGKIVGVIGGLATLIFGAYQIYVNTKINQATFWLELRRMFSDYQDVHVKLRPRGAWYASPEHPNLDELPSVEPYMGLLEHCNRMLEQGLIDWKTFKHIYGYRVDNIMKNPAIVKAKLIENEENWENFIRLSHKLGYRRDGSTYSKPERK
jgi:hypothetical protein